MPSTETAGVDADDRILYDKLHGALYHRDAIGTDIKRVKFADNTHLSSVDFLVV